MHSSPICRRGSAVNKGKRRFLKAMGAASFTAPLVTACSSLPAPPVADNGLAVITADAVQITVDERKARVARAQQLMQAHDLDALVLEPGSAMSYFSGIQWWRSERLTAVVIPAVGEIGVITPFFEQPSVRESMAFGDDVRTWHEHESPFDKAREFLADRGLQTGRIGLEETVRYFVADGLTKALPGFELAAATAVTRGCRMYKSVAELRLMRIASEVTLQAYAHVHAQISAGMTGSDIKALMNTAQTQLGGARAWSLVLVGPASAYPHGTAQQKAVAKGDIVLMDCGCSVHGYQSDISRTFVFGAPSTRQRQVWEQVRQGQEIAFAAAVPGAPAGSVDDAVRTWYESLGYGPGYKTPGLSHRTGHGIGMDGHEPVNFVQGEKTRLAPGMCFSNEPGIYDFDEFGVRLEDCLYITPGGPAWFTVPPDDLDAPLGTMGPVI
ncbi:MAG: aminopeptidase P family protein [Gammaproteobacteria bacterium]|nr:aminopeptidase P family protein [Gammaproteobacteria bacterium]